jgi:hypothetical protein
MSDLTIFKPPYDVQCKQCSIVGPGVILRKVGDPRNFTTVCGRCLALALQEVTRQNWLSQWVLWQANQQLGKEIQEAKNAQGNSNETRRK